MRETSDTPGSSETRERPRRIRMWPRRPSALSRIGRAVGFVACCVWLGLILVSDRVTFVPSTAWTTLRWIPFTLCGVASSLWIIGWLRARSPDFGGLSVTLRVGGFYVFLPLCLLFVSWSNVGFILPAFFTHFVTPRRHDVLVLQKTYVDASRHGCRYRIEGAVFADAFAGYYCATQREWAALPLEGRMEVWYRTSWFGRRIEYVAPYDPSFHGAG